MSEIQTVWLQPNQQKLGRLIIDERATSPTWLGFGGPRGGTKSHTIRAMAMECQTRYPNSRTFIVRKNWTDLYENHYLKFQQDFPWMSEYWNGSHKEFTFRNGHTLAFKFADTEDQVEQLVRGPEARHVFLDQAEQFSEKQIKRMKTMNRWKDVGPGACKMILAFNPGGPGNEFLKRVFYDKKYQANESAAHYAFIFAKGWENWEWFRPTGLYASSVEFYADTDENRFRNFIKHTDYGRTLWELPESLRLGELYGSFEHFAGQYYGGVWDENVHRLRAGHAEFVIQPWWRRWLAVDWGFAHNAACGWFAAGKLTPAQAEKAFGLEITQDIEVIICYRELVVSETQEQDFAAQIAQLTPLEERKAITRLFFSTEAFGVRGSAQLLTPVLRQYGLPAPEPAANQRVTTGVGRENERIGGWRLLYNMLKQTVTMSGKDIPPQAYAGGPLFMVGGDCPQTAEAIPALMRDPDNPEDVMKMDSKADDIGDEIRYGLTEYLRAKGETPLAIQRQEVYASINNPTERVLRMREFEQQVASTRTRVGRGRSWR